MDMVIGSGLFIALLGSLQSPQNTPKPEPAKSAAESQQQQSKQAVPPSEEQEAAAQSRQDSQTEADKNEARFAQEVTKWSAIAQAASAVLVTVFTGVLVYYSHRGWKVARAAADAAKASADAASRSAATAEQALHLSERAWIKFSDWTVVIAPNQRAVFHVIATNSGKTPAHMKDGTVTFFLGRQEDIPDEPVYDFNYGKSVTTIHAGARFRKDFTTDQPLTPENVASLNAGSQVFAVWGIARYNDVFQKEHVTKFGMFYNGALKAFALIAKPGYTESD